MKLNDVQFSDDFLDDFHNDGDTLSATVNGVQFGTAKHLQGGGVVLLSVDDTGNEVIIDYDTVGEMIDDLVTMQLD